MKENVTQIADAAELAGIEAYNGFKEPQSNQRDYMFENHDVKDVESPVLEDLPKYDFSGPENKGITAGINDGAGGINDLLTDAENETADSKLIYITIGRFAKTVGAYEFSYGCRNKAVQELKGNKVYPNSSKTFFQCLSNYGVTTESKDSDILKALWTVVTSRNRNGLTADAYGKLRSAVLGIKNKGWIIDAWEQGASFMVDSKRYRENQLCYEYASALATKLSEEGYLVQINQGSGDDMPVGKLSGREKAAAANAAGAALVIELYAATSIGGTSADGPGFYTLYNNTGNSNKIAEAVAKKLRDKSSATGISAAECTVLGAASAENVVKADYSGGLRKSMVQTIMYVKDNRTPAFVLNLGNTKIGCSDKNQLLKKKVKKTMVECIVNGVKETLPCK